MQGEIKDVMKFEKVESSNLEAIGYAADNRILGVQFKSSGVAFYMYLGVPANKYEELKKAESAGSFLNSQIKPYYEAVKVELFQAAAVS